jgi:Membrane-associated sensor, integral membrane domain
MDKPDVTIQADGLFVSSNMPPSQTEKRLACVFALGLVAIFFIVSHFADNRPHPIPGFILAFSAAMFVCDIIAAILLFAQFAVLRSLALLVIANGYVLTAFILVPYTMTFPGVFGPGPLVGGLQSTAFLYIVWHTGFLLFVTGYALLKGANDPVKLFSRRRVPTAIIASIALTAAVVILAAWISVAGEPFLPQTIRPDGLGFTPMNLYAVGSTSVCQPCALS